MIIEDHAKESLHTRLVRQGFITSAFEWPGHPEDRMRYYFVIGEGSAVGYGKTHSISYVTAPSHQEACVAILREHRYKRIVQCTEVTKEEYEQPKQEK